MFVPEHSGAHYSPHVTIGIGTVDYLNALLAAPFDSFTFSPLERPSTTSATSNTSRSSFAAYLTRTYCSGADLKAAAWRREDGTTNLLTPLREISTR